MNLGLYPEGVDLEAAVLHMARLAGCNCDPDIEVGSVDPTFPQLKNHHVMHDDWCRLLSRLERRN